MSDKEMVFELHKRIFAEWRAKRLTWQEVKAKYGFSKKWYYKWLNIFYKDGDEGLRNKKIKRSLPHPQSLGFEKEAIIMSYVYDNPTHGPHRIAREIAFRVSGKTVWKMLCRRDLNTRRKRRLWAHNQGKPVLTGKEIQILAAKDRHIESREAGELISMDTFWCNVKSVGKIFQYTACDTYSSFGWARVYAVKTGDSSIAFTDYILRNLPEGKIKRILTDQGNEFYSARHRDKLVNHYFTEFLMTKAIVHSVTKPAHPWTNGYAERLNQTIWQEFYLSRLSKPYNSIEDLNNDLDVFMRDYNWKRMHSGYKLIAGGYKCPGHAFFDTREREKTIELKY